MKQLHGEHELTTTVVSGDYKAYVDVRKGEKKTRKMGELKIDIACREQRTQKEMEQQSCYSSAKRKLEA